MSAVRALRQIATPLVARRTLCTATVVPRVAGMRVASLASRNVAMRGFASSSSRFGQGSTDVTLSQKLQEELSYEKETGGASEEVPQFVKDFKAHDTWLIEDTFGQDEVTLSRKFGNENLRLIFSITDLQPAEEEYAAEEGEEGESEGAVYPIRASLSITKNNGSGALNVDMIVQEGIFVIDSISFYEDAKVGTELTAEADWKRRGLYIGPQFDTLDVAVQDEFEAFLRERGIDDTLAQFIPQFAEHKEQKEYVKWLGKVKSFVDL
ncbi:Mitochondrial acidic protein mam33 [Leucoagaricus sp. SymC.cos]|nr:Mitochondrial acidic protein mam33 [Leucoagaricus sp. SymC.cos]